MRFWHMFLVLLMPVLVSCDNTNTQDEPPYAIYRGEFNSKNAACAQQIIRDIALKWNFSIVENKQRAMKAINTINEGFHILMMEKDGDQTKTRFWILSIGSFVYGSKISVHIFSYKDLADSEKDKLAEDVLSQLDMKCDTRLYRYKEPYAKKSDKK